MLWLQVLRALQAAVDIRCRCIEAPAGLPAAAGLPSACGGAGTDDLAPAPVLVLFSGGVDSTLLAALAHRALPEQAPIDLATICFDGGRSPDRHVHASLVVVCLMQKPHMLLPDVVHNRPCSSKCCFAASQRLLKGGLLSCVQAVCAGRLPGAGGVCARAAVAPDRGGRQPGGPGRAQGAHPG